MVATRVAGSLLLAYGLTESEQYYRVMGYGPTGASAPANLRAQAAGPNTVFTWDATATPPPAAT